MLLPILLQSRKYKCRPCHKDFKRGGHLKAHNNAIHFGVKYPCDKCEYKATNSSNLRTHIKSKHDGIKVPCDQCDFKASNRSGVLKHKQGIHLGLTPYACVLCDYKSLHKSNLTKHFNRKHIQPKQLLQCLECEFKTAIECDLRRHKNIHEQVVEIFSCDLCSFKAKWGRLEDHKRRVHRQEKVKCNLCDFSSCLLYTSPSPRDS